MGQCSFLKYKNFISLLLCSSYILQLLVFSIINYCENFSGKDIWTFQIGFWGINLLLIFLLDFFHIGIPQKSYDFFTIILLLLMSGGCYCTLYYQIHWGLTIALIVIIAIVLMIFRYHWCIKLKIQYFENQSSLKEETIVRFSLYLLPTLFSSVICYHIENVSSSSTFAILIQLLYVIIAFAIISSTYVKWYRCIKKVVPYKDLIIEIIWLSISFLVFMIGIKCFKNVIMSICLPILGIIPIFIRHKNTK